MRGREENSIFILDDRFKKVDPFTQLKVLGKVESPELFPQIRNFTEAHCEERNRFRASAVAGTKIGLRSGFQVNDDCCVASKNL